MRILKYLPLLLILAAGPLTAKMNDAQAKVKIQQKYGKAGMVRKVKTPQGTKYQVGLNAFGFGFAVAAEGKTWEEAFSKLAATRKPDATSLPKN